MDEQGAELVGRHSLLAFEDAVEIGHVIESAAESDLGNGHVRIDEHTRDMPQADFGQRIDKALSGRLFDEAAERNFGHVDRFGDIPQGDLSVEIVVHVGKNRLQALRIRDILLLGKGQVGEQLPVGGERERIEDGQDIEQRLHTADRTPFVDALEGGSHFESRLFRKEHPAPGLLEKLLEGEHVTAIAPVGEPFDASRCEAILAVDPKEGEESGIVKEVYAKGYEQNGKILRFAQVLVTK